MSQVKPIPDGYSTATPYLIIKDAAKAIDFYKKAFNAKEIMRFANPMGKISHAEIKIGNSIIMLGEECEEMKCYGPTSIGGSPVSILLYVENVDEVFNQAVSAGATVKMPIKNQFYGDRSGGLVDPFGHVWFVSTHVEDVSPEDLKKRSEEFYKSFENKK